MRPTADDEQVQTKICMFNRFRTKFYAERDLALQPHTLFSWFKRGHDSPINHGSALGVRSRISCKGRHHSDAISLAVGNYGENSNAIVSIAPFSRAPLHPQPSFQLWLGVKVLIGNDNNACFSCKGEKVERKIRMISHFLGLRAFEIDDHVLDLSGNRLGVISKLYRENFHDWAEIVVSGKIYSVKASAISYDPDPNKWTDHQMFKWSRTYGNDFLEKLRGSK